jgi:putative transposase
MKNLYPIAQLSKQALFKFRKRCQDTDLIKQQVVEECTRIRKDHKRMSCRRMYWRSSVPVGRDIFEQIGFANGYKIRIKPKAEKTTWSQKIEVYENRIEGRSINGINQILQSDIFYFKVGDKNYYGVTIIDVYSRRLLAVKVSNNLTAIENVRALQMAFTARQGHSLKGCIFHSDRGVQYISEIQKQIIHDNGLIPSMCKLPQENAYVERVQGTLKYEYIFEHTFKASSVQKQMNRLVYLYNNGRPHTELGNRTPVEYEKYIQTLPAKDHPMLSIYKWSHPIINFIDKEKNLNINHKKSQPVSG